MSASLVGSEMCIRDSGSSALARVGSFGARALARLPRRSSRRPRCRTTVSYTHLTLPTICSV
eukprot:10743752-Alexandrium_andersonii.AAC.1